jgi:hypothetical protein
VAAKRRDTATAVERGDEDALDPVEARDVDTVEGDELEEAGLSELDVDEDGFDDADDADDADEVEPDEVDEVDAVLVEGEEGEEVVPTVPAEAAFDDEDEALVVAAVSGDDDDDDGIEGLRDGEFVCRSCYMAKLESQLADPDRMLCRDCA